MRGLVRNNDVVFSGIFESLGMNLQGGLEIQPPKKKNELMPQRLPSQKESTLPIILFAFKLQGCRVILSDLP